MREKVSYMNPMEYLFLALKDVKLKFIQLISRLLFLQITEAMNTLDDSGICQYRQRHSLIFNNNLINEE